MTCWGVLCVCVCHKIQYTTNPFDYTAFFKCVYSHSKKKVQGFYISGQECGLYQTLQLDKYNLI